ncbi:MAG: winged helix-turn-helix domain-containing protein [Candidatus Planktophila sp.]|nr:winged helix-turn-helix domain-containing protein [Candidatus Planktophila sp.]
MKVSQLLPLLRSRTQADLLALLFLNPDKEFSVTDAAKLVGSSVPGMQHEVARLVRTGFIQDRKEGNSRLVRASKESIIFKPLSDLLAVTHGPLPVLNKELAGVAGIVSAYIYGSWAARYSGESGPVPADIDVLVVGNADLDELQSTAERAELQLYREVNIRRVSLQAWKKGDGSFLKTVRAKPLVPLTLNEKTE